ncbi:TPA: hypothetical protein SMR79_003445 [Proteus mirabilis]|nr:hypothetical protein [Proteus mirabilis]
MSDNHKYTAIKVRPLCTACGDDCGEHLITVGENIILCFKCIDKTKEKVDLYRKEIAEKEIKEIIRLIERYGYQDRHCRYCQLASSSWI